MRAQLSLPVGVSQEEALAAARAEPNVARYLEGAVVREIFVAGRMVSFVVKG